MTGIRQHSISKNNKKYGRFLDNDFKKPDYEGFEKLVKELRPEIAVLPDLFSDKELEIALKIYHKYDFCKFIFVPKYDECFKKLSKDLTLGIPIPNKFSITPVDYDNFLGFKTHILGGTPPVQEKLAMRYNGVSADTNSFTKVMNISGKAFTPTRPHWHKYKDMVMMDTFKLSLENIKIFWKNYERRKRRQRTLW